MKLDKALMYTINKYLTDNNVLEYIYVNLARVTLNRKCNIFYKYKANTKMLTYEKIKPLILEAARSINKDIIDIQEINPWPRMKSHQILLDKYIPYRYTVYITQLEKYKASTDTLDILKNIIEAEYGITLPDARLIKSINHYMEEVQNDPNSKKYTTIAT
jgi:hypothetical protein